MPDCFGALLRSVPGFVSDVRLLVNLSRSSLIVSSAVAAMSVCITQRFCHLSLSRAHSRGAVCFCDSSCCLLFSYAALACSAPLSLSWIQRPYEPTSFFNLGVKHLCLYLQTYLPFLPQSFMLGRRPCLWSWTLGARLLSSETLQPLQAPAASQTTGVSWIAVAKALRISGLSNRLIPRTAPAPALPFKNLRLVIAIVSLLNLYRRLRR